MILVGEVIVVCVWWNYDCWEIVFICVVLVFDIEGLGLVLFWIFCVGKFC